MFHKSMSIIFENSVLKNVVTEHFAHWSLLVSYCLLLLTFCSIFVNFCSFRVVFRSLLVTFCLLLVAFCLSLAIFCSWLAYVGSMPFSFPSFLLTFCFSYGPNVLINFNVVLLFCVITIGKYLLIR